MDPTPLPTATHPKEHGGGVASFEEEQQPHHSPPPYPEGDSVATPPSPSLSDLIMRSKDLRGQQKISTMIQRADKLLSELRKPLPEEVSSQTPTTPAPQPRWGEMPSVQEPPSTLTPQPIPGSTPTTNAPPTDGEVVDLLSQLLDTPLAWERVWVPGPGEGVPGHMEQDVALDQEGPLSPPHPCTGGTGMQQRTGRPYSPLSPIPMRPSPGTKPEGRGTRNKEAGTGWPYSPLSPSPLDHSPRPTTGGPGGSTRGKSGEDGELQGTPTRTQGNRSGPDYALREYIQGNVVFIPTSTGPTVPYPPIPRARVHPPSP